VRKATLLIVSLLVSGAAVQAQDAPLGPDQNKVLEDYIKTVKGDLVGKRDSALHTLIQLSPEQAKVFWPITKEYDQEMKALREQRLAMLESFIEVKDELTSETATALAERALSLADQRNQVRSKYFKIMSEKVSPVAAVQFLQLETQFETMADLKLATAVPLAGYGMD